MNDSIIFIRSLQTEPYERRRHSAIRRHKSPRIPGLYTLIDAFQSHRKSPGFEKRKNPLKEIYLTRGLRYGT